MTDTSTVVASTTTDLFHVLYADQHPHSQAGTPRYGVCWQRGEQTLHVLLPAHLRAEVIIKPALSRLPNAPYWLLGLVNIRGRLTPVIDFAQWAGLPADKSPHTNILYIGEGEKSVAWCINQVPELLFTKNRSIDLNIVPEPLHPYVNGLAYYNQHSWLDIDFSAWLTSLAHR